MEARETKLFPTPLPPTKKSNRRRNRKKPTPAAGVGAAGATTDKKRPAEKTTTRSRSRKIIKKPKPSQRISDDTENTDTTTTDNENEEPEKTTSRTNSTKKAKLNCLICYEEFTSTSSYLKRNQFSSSVCGKIWKQFSHVLQLHCHSSSSSAAGAEAAGADNGSSEVLQGIDCNYYRFQLLPFCDTCTKDVIGMTKLHEELEQLQMDVLDALEEIRLKIYKSEGIRVDNVFTKRGDPLHDGVSSHDYDSTVEAVRKFAIKDFNPTSSVRKRRSKPSTKKKDKAIAKTQSHKVKSEPVSSSELITADLPDPDENAGKEPELDLSLAKSVIKFEPSSTRIMMVCPSIDQLPATASASPSAELTTERQDDKDDNESIEIVCADWVDDDEREKGVDRGGKNDPGEDLVVGNEKSLNKNTKSKKKPVRQATGSSSANGRKSKLNSLIKELSQRTRKKMLQKREKKTPYSSVAATATTAAAAAPAASSSPCPSRRGPPRPHNSASTKSNSSKYRLPLTRTVDGSYLYNDVEIKYELIDGQPKYKCTLCNSTQSVLLSMRRHVRESHPAGDSSSNGFTCKICSKVFTNAGSLPRHNRIFHSTKERPSYTCELCGKTLRTWRSMSSHKALIHAHGVEKLLNCEICAKPCRNSNTMDSHRLSHMNELEREEFIKEEQAAVAAAAAAAAADPAATKNYAKQNRIHQCTYCGKVMSSKPGLQTHELIHTNSLPFVCEVCGWGFRHRCNLLTHLETHQSRSERKFNYVCEYPDCGKKYSTRLQLCNHSFTHRPEEDRPHRCHICGIGFVRTHDLKCHKRTHTGERPYECAICTKAFTRSYHLTRHCKQVHNINSSQIITAELVDPDKVMIDGGGDGEGGGEEEQQQHHITFTIAGLADGTTATYQIPETFAFGSVVRIIE